MSALFSPCGRYRYRLDGEAEAGLLDVYVDALVLFAMLNPSKAGRVERGVEIVDPTRTRVANFTGAWGYRRFAIVNAFAHVATDPAELVGLDYAEAVGPDNDRHIAAAAAEADLIVAAWGASYPRPLARRVAETLAILTAAGPVHHLGLTKHGDPRHPLYLRADTQPSLLEGTP